MKIYKVRNLRSGRMSANNASAFRKVINAEQYWVGKHKLQASDVVNSSTVTGTTVEDALDYISSSGVGPVLNLNGLTAATQTMTTGTAAGAGNDFNITTSGLSTHVFNMPSASATVRGVVTTGAQTFAGAKTFSNVVTLSAAPVLSTGTITVGAGTVTVQAATDTLVALATTDALTNKTLTSNTNNVIARGLWHGSGAGSVSTYAATAPGAGGGQILATDVGGTTASWQAVSALGAITSLNTLTGTTQTFATGNAAGGGNDFNISSVGTQHTFNIPDASGTVRGVVTTGTQTFAGAKTFSGIVTLSSAPVLSTGTVTVGGSAVTIPSGVETLVGRATTDTLTNKTLEDSTTSIVDAGATSRVAKFECSSISNSTTRTFTFPDANVVLVGDTNTQTLTNKTATDNTNNLIARGLWAGSGSGSVSTYAATAPSSGQVLTATGATTATWQTPATGSGLGTSISDTTFDQSGVALTASVTTTPALWTSGTLVADAVYAILWGCKAAGSVSAASWQYLHSADTLVARYSTNGYGGTQGILSNAGPVVLNVYDASATTTRHPGFFAHIYVTTAGTVCLKLVKTADTVTISSSFVKIWRLV